MLKCAYDVNGDGRNDVITALAAHGYGLAWYEQLAEKDANGSPQWRGHTFMNKELRENRYGVAFSQLHAVELIDMDGDGLKDLVTGKCFWAHGPTRPRSRRSAVSWFRLVAARTAVDWVPHLVDNDSGVGPGRVADVMAMAIRMIIGNKKGTFVFLPRTKNHENGTNQPQVKFLPPATRYCRQAGSTHQAAATASQPANSAEIARAKRRAGFSELPPSASDAFRLFPVRVNDLIQASYFESARTRLGELPSDHFCRACCGWIDSPGTESFAQFSNEDDETRMKHRRFPSCKACQTLPKRFQLLPNTQKGG